ncbi:MAG: hypothetical protein U0Y82_16845 [Thermoleophilia bacterium]
MSPEQVLRDSLPALVDRRSLLRLGLTENTVDRLWRTVQLVRVPTDSKWYASRDEVLSVLQRLER